MMNSYAAEQETIRVLKEGKILPSIFWLLEQYRAKHNRLPLVIGVNATLQAQLEQELALPRSFRNSEIFIEQCRVTYFYCSKDAAARHPEACYIVLADWNRCVEFAL